MDPTLSEMEGARHSVGMGFFFLKIKSRESYPTTGAGNQRAVTSGDMRRETLRLFIFTFAKFSS